MIERLGNRMTDWAQRWVPDPFVFAVALTGVTFGLALLVTDAGLWQAVDGWGKGFWELLAFGMQMCIVLVTGHALASSTPVKRGITWLADRPRTARSAVAMVAAVAAVCGLLNWGLGLIAGALLARETAVRGQARGLQVHYPLLAAAGYVGLLVWHGGFSGSVPLLIATEGHFLEKSIGVIPIRATLFSPLNLTVAVALLVLIPVVSAALHPKDRVKTARDFDVDVEETSEEADEGGSPARRIERSRIVSLVAGALGIAFLVRTVWVSGFHPNLNLVNLAFLSLGLLLHKHPAAYVAAVADGAKACAGIILQFPFYGGIMGVMKYTGLMTAMAAAATHHVGPALYPLVTFLSAGLVNLFVPSGGGQWAVQGPIAVEAARMLHLSLPRTAMAVAFGDEWTNMLQPFWALALLGITRLRAGDIMGYTVIYLVVALPVYLLALAFIPV